MPQYPGVVAGDDGLQMKLLFYFQPWVPARVLTRVVRVEVDEHPLDFPISDLKNVAPSSSTPLRDASPPRAILMFSVARAFTHQEIAPGKNPIKMGIVVLDRFNGFTYITKQLANLFLSNCQPPLWKKHLGVVSEKI